MQRKSAERMMQLWQRRASRRVLQPRRPASRRRSTSASRSSCCQGLRDEEAIADEEDEELQRYLLGPPTVAAERTVEMCPAARARLEAAMSDEAAVLIVAAFQACSLGRGGADKYFDEEFHVATVRYSHALRRFKQAHSEFCCWSERSWPEVVDWAIRLAALGHPIPAAEAVAQRIGFDLPRAVAVCQAEWEAEGEEHE